MRSFTRFAAAAACALPLIAAAGSFGVSPIRVDLDRGARSAVVEVTNDDQRKLSFQVKLAEWTQDASGQDQHADSSDLIFFPPIFTVEPGEKRIIRVGTKPGAAPGEREKAYRLYIEELPPPAEPGGGAQLRIALRFALPVFVAPAAPQKRLAVELARAAPGKVNVRLANQGNQSHKIESVRLRRGNDVVGEIPGWYVLAGATRDYTVPVERARCPLEGPLEVVAQNEGAVLVRQSVEAASQLCQQP
jgi:fimbrial chaperone protein